MPRRTRQSALAAPAPISDAPVASARALDAHRLSATELADLVAAFSEVSDRLQQTHEALRAEVARLKDELHSAHEQLRRTRALAALGEMAAGIAHEIRNPLGSIRLYAAALEDDLADRPEQRHTARKIVSSVRGLDRVVNDVLAFARPLEPQVAVIDTREALSRALWAAEARLRAARVETRIDIAVGAESLRADGDLLRQALVNLLRNAADAVEQRPGDDAPRRIVIRVERRRARDAAGQWAEMTAIDVRDTGPGLPPSAAQRLFQPFFTTKRDGAGLGLAIVHRIVDAHAGCIRAENAAAPPGARFTLLLPVSAPEPDASHTNAPSRALEGVHS